MSEDERQPTEADISSASQFESCYQEEKNYWGTEPSKIIEIWAPRLKPGSVLDVGAGDGRNSVFLATQGFDITALDTAPTGVKHIKEKSEESGVKERLRTVVADIIEWEPTEQFDNIITNFTLHFVGAKNIKPVIEKLMGCTVPGGVNIIDDFTQNGPLAERNPENYVTPSLLEDMYRGWEILRSAVRPVQTKKFETPGKPYMHEAIAFVARKPVHS